VQWRLLTSEEKSAAQAQWQAFFGSAFQGWWGRRKRYSRQPEERLWVEHREGFKAVFKYQQQTCDATWLIVPLDGISPGVRNATPMEAYECDGPLVLLGDFRYAEFFISPRDFEWTMVHTHEDHVLYGPFFLRRDESCGIAG
jgi:hypothetical protein